MKKIMPYIVLLLIAICMYSCTKSPEEKAQILFEESIKPRMGNPKQYEFIQMSQLDSAFSSLEIDRTYLALKDSLKANRVTLFDVMSKNYYAKKKKEEGLKSEIKEYEDSFTPHYIGWHSKIEFRAANLFGGVQIYLADVYFNKDLTQCLDWFVKAE